MITHLHQKRPLSSSSATAGFTLIEALVVVIMVAILMAIASPGWLAFVNRQRVNSVRDAALGTLRTAQVQAQQRREAQTVTVANEGGNPVLIVNEQQLSLSNGDLPEDSITVTGFVLNDAAWVAEDSITFNYQGAIAGGRPFKIDVEPTIGGETRCVIVTTVLGGMQTLNGNDCNSAEIITQLGEGVDTDAVNPDD